MAENTKEKESNGREMSLEAKIEAVLFVAPRTVSIKQLSETLGMSVKIIEAAIAKLVEEQQERGYRIQRHKGEMRLTSAPEAAAIIERFLDLEATSRLSTAALECLSIIAYQQPVTRPQIDAVRGVNSDGVLRNLLSNGLVEETGRAEGPGRPILYVSSPDFLQHFGLGALEELPPLNLEELFAKGEAASEIEE